MRPHENGVIIETPEEVSLIVAATKAADLPIPGWNRETGMISRQEAGIAFRALDAHARKDGETGEFRDLAVEVGMVIIASNFLRCDAVDHVHELSSAAQNIPQAA